MTANEFTTWLQGFMEALDGTPTEEQWSKVKEKLKEVRPNVWINPPFTLPHVPYSNSPIPIKTGTGGTGGKLGVDIDPTFEVTWM